MAKRFDGKTALVTGGSRGIGRSIVEALIQNGAKVYAIGKSQDNLDKLKSEIPSVNSIQADIVDWDATRLAIEGIGAIDLLVNNAATTLPLTDFVDTEKEKFENIIDTNIKSAFNISQVVARGLIAAGRPGSVVNISSVVGQRAKVGFSSYCVSKAMLEMLTKVMALELGPNKIRVNTVSPTAVMTDLSKQFLTQEEFAGPFLKRHPLGKFAELQDMVDATLFLLSDEASMINGSTLAVDGGYLLS